MNGREINLPVARKLYISFFMFSMKQSLFFERGAGWLVSLVLVITSTLIGYIPPKYTEFYEGDIALSYTLHDTVP